jgi:predicted membrane protein
MISESKIAEIEAKDTNLLTEEDNITLQYVNAVREARTWYNMLLTVGTMDTAFNFARNGRASILRALNTQAKLIAIWGIDALKIREAGLEDDNNILRIQLQDNTSTIAFVKSENPSALGVVKYLQTIAEKREIKTISLLGSLAKQNLLPPDNANSNTRIRYSLKILDKLLFTGKIDNVTYNKKCRMLQLKLKAA